MINASMLQARSISSDSIKQHPIITGLILLVFPIIVLISNCGMHTLPEGVEIARHPSPNGTYVLTIYRCDDSIRGAITYNRWLSLRRNAYWERDCSEAHCEWVGPDKVKINGTILNVWKDSVAAAHERGVLVASSFNSRKPSDETNLEPSQYNSL